MPSKKKSQYRRPWWYSPEINRITATTGTVRRCGLPPLIIQRIFSAMAKEKHPTTRPNRARKSWLENLIVDGVKCRLSCHIENDMNMIVVTYISVPKGAFKGTIKLDKISGDSFGE